MKILIPKKEIETKFIRSSGPGGQNVNRRATKVQLRWNIYNSKGFTEEQKEQMFKRFPTLITKNGEIIVESQEKRLQKQNREIAIKKLNELIYKALKKTKKRISTKPSKSAKKRRLEEKKRRSDVKKSRKKLKYFI